MSNIPITIIKGDITKYKGDAIVNAANNALVMGGGIDYSIHLAAGPKLQEECSTLRGCDTGDAKITHGYNLPAKYIIHTVGPFGDDTNKEELLACSYRRSLEVAKEHGIKSIAFPSISTGNYGFPIKDAMPIVFDTVSGFLKHETDIEVTFVLWTDRELDIYNKFYKEYIKS